MSVKDQVSDHLSLSLSLSLFSHTHTHYIATVVSHRAAVVQAMHSVLQAVLRVQWLWAMDPLSLSVNRTLLTAQVSVYIYYPLYPISSLFNPLLLL